MVDYLESVFQIIYAAMTALFSTDNFFGILFLFNNCLITLCLFIWLCKKLMRS